MTIASNYKIKNPDIIFAPADYINEHPTTEDEINDLLEKIKNNNV